MDDRTNTKDKRTSETKITRALGGVICATVKKKQELRVKIDRSNEIRKKEAVRRDVMFCGKIR